MVKRKNQKIVPLTEYYQHIHDNFLYGDNPESQGKKDYRERLLGPDLIVAVPFEYTLLSFKKKYPDWDEKSLRERAALLVHDQLENMSEIIREHLRYQKQLAEESKRRQEKNNG